MAKKRLDDQPEISKKKPARRAKKPALDLSTSKPAAKPAAKRVRAAKPAAKTPAAKVRSAVSPRPAEPLQVEDGALEKFRAELSVADAPLEIAPRPAMASFLEQGSQTKRRPIPAVISLYAVAGALALLSIVGGIIMNGTWAAYQGPTNAPPGGNIPITIWNSKTASPVDSKQTTSSINIDGYIKAGPADQFNVSATGMMQLGSSALNLAGAENLLYGIIGWVSSGNLMLMKHDTVEVLRLTPGGNLGIGGAIQSYVSNGNYTDRIAFNAAGVRVGENLNSADVGYETSVDDAVFTIEGSENNAAGVLDIASLAFSNDSNRASQTNAPIAKMTAYTDASAGVNNGGIKLYTKNGTNLVERVRVNKDGVVGIGGASSDRFQVDANGNITKINNVALTSWPAANASGVLTNNGAGALTWGAPGLGGSGTAGKLPKFTAPSTLGDSVMAESGGNIGIGTTSPSSLFTVDSRTVTTGTIASITPGVSTAQGAGQVIGLDLNLANYTTPAAGQGIYGMRLAMPTESTSSGNITVIGYDLNAISNPVTTAGTGAIDWRGYEVGLPNITGGGSTTIASGFVAATRSITTGGTVNGLYVWPISGYSAAAGTLNGIKIDNVPTPAAGAENAINIGTGWDTDLMFNDASPKVQIANGGTMTVADSSGNALLSLADGGASGNLTVGNFKMTASPTDGFYLKSDASGNASWAAIPGGYTGGGASGQAVFWTGAAAFAGDNAFFWDNTNKRLGIGTTSPPTKLTVAGGSTTLVQIGGDGGCGGAYSAITLGLTVAPDATCKNYTFLKGPGDASLYINRATGDAIRFRENNVDQIAITSGGSLELDWGNTNSGSVIGGIRFGYASGEGVASKRTAGGNQWGLDLYTNSTNRLAITNAGNIGIGNSAPIARLDVAAAARSGTHASGQTMYVTGTLSNGQSGPAAGNIEFRHDNATQGIGFGYSTIYQTGTNTNQELNLLSRGTSPITLNAYPYSTGNVGIGTASPAIKLEVRQDGNAASTWNARMGLSNSSADKQVFFGNYGSIGGVFAHNFALNTWADLYLNTVTGTTGVVIKGDGNVGVGTTTPGSKLTVTGSGIWDGAALELNNTGTSGRRWTIFSTNTSFGQGAGKLLFYNATGSSDAMVIDSSNIVGIGTNTPGAGTTSASTKLEVFGPDAQLRVRNSNDSSAGGFIGDSYAILQLGMYNPTGSVYGQIAANATRSFFGMGADGKVGSMTNNFGSPAYRNLLDDGSGNVLIEGGSTDKTLGVGVGTTFGRHLTISAGQGAAGYGGGSLYLYSGASGATAGGSGAVLVSSKDTSVGSSGFVQISTGYASGAGNYVGSITIDTGTIFSSANRGQVFIGNSNALNVEIGRAGGSGVLIYAPASSYTERLCHGGSTGDGVAFFGYLTDCKNTPQADYAELYPMSSEVEYGDIVVASDMLVKTKDGDKVPVLEKSAKSYQNAVYGVASDNYGDPSSIGYNIDEKDNPKPLALNGRVPTKVSTENGSIKIGDAITTSSKPGVGMRATKPGMIIGYALNSWNGAGVGKINVFINTEYYAGSMFDENGGVSAEFKAALSLWGASSGWISCPVSGDCGCPNGYFVTDIRDRGRAIQCHSL